MLLLPMLAMVASVSACVTPQGVDVVFLLDSSASSAAHRAEAIKFIGSLCRALEPGLDHVKVLRMSRDVYGLYDGDPRSRNLTAALEEYSQVKPEESGTAYGEALKRGLAEALAASKEGLRPAILVVGDGADEKVAGGGNVHWDQLGRDFADFPGDGRLAFVYIEPKWADRFDKALSGALRERVKFMSPPEAAGDEAVRTLRTLIGR